MTEIGNNLLQVFGAQTKQMSGFSEEMNKLQNTLTVGVDAFAERLPHSVDQTLVQFDAALGARFSPWFRHCPNERSFARRFYWND